MTRRPRTSLAARITALCLAVAAIAVVVAGLLWNRLVSDAARDVARDSLRLQATSLAQVANVDADGDDFEGPRLKMPRLAAHLQAARITLVVRRENGSLHGNGQPERIAREAGIDRMRAGGSISRMVRFAGDDYLVEARAYDGERAFALVSRVRLAAATEEALVGNVLLATGVGLGVAALAGLLLARVLSRPLRSTATVARQMRAGRRDLRAEVAGPTEVADVADSVNQLADALQYSESRQREFLLSVSHELRTPLTSLKGFAESLADGVVEGPDVQRVGQTMSGEALRLERLVTDLLDLARLGADEFHLDVTEVELGAFAQGCADVWRARCAREDVVFQLEQPDRPTPVPADPRRLRQVVDILADNALRVTPPGAPLVLALDARPDAAILQVRDGGPGLSDEDYEVAFERGALRDRYRSRRPVGSGVGLALAHEMVTRMGGTLRAGPAPEGGAAFTITLPLAGRLPNPNTTTKGLERP